LTLHYGLLLCRSGPAGAGRIQLGFRPGSNANPVFRTHERARNIVSDGGTLWR